MSFKNSVLQATKLMTDEHPGWEFENRAFRKKGAYCEYIIDPLWSFKPSKAVSLQPVVGVYIPEVEEIWSEVSRLGAKDNCTFFTKVKKPENSKLSFRPTIRGQNHTDSTHALAAVRESINYSFHYGEHYFAQEYSDASRKSFLQSIKPVTRGNTGQKYCIVRGLLGDIEYIERFYRNEIDPDGPKSMDTAARILEYFD